jgi:hypothetical protein
MGPFLGCLLPPLPSPDLQEVDKHKVNKANNRIDLTAPNIYVIIFVVLAYLGAKAELLFFDSSKNSSKVLIKLIQVVFS